MLSLLPRQYPPLSLMLDDLGAPSVKALSIALGVSSRTVKRWRDDDDAPRPVMLALFWITRWGQSAVNSKAHNDAVMYAGYVGALKTENAALQAEIARVVALGNCGAANAPVWRELPIAPGFEPPGPRALVTGSASRPTAL